MSGLAKYRTLTQHTLKDVTKYLKATDHRLTAPILCNIEKGIVNPTPKTLTALSEYFGVQIDCLMSPEEVDYGILSASKNAVRLRESRLRRRTKNFCAAIPAEMMDGLKDKLRRCGYHDQTSWLMLKLKALDIEDGKIKAAKAKTKEQTAHAICGK